MRPYTESKTQFPSQKSAPHKCVQNEKSTESFLDSIEFKEVLKDVEDMIEEEEV